MVTPPVLAAAALLAACAGRAPAPNAPAPNAPAPNAPAPNVAAPDAAPPLPEPLASLAPVERAAAARLQAARAALPAGAPRTRAERSGYLETSRHADVLAFVDTLARLAPGALRVRTLGLSPEGRALPLVVASRPAVATPEEARRLGRPVAFVQANIHAGEVEGKEALQALLRDLALGVRPNVLDSLVLLAVPIYNADGNERLAPQAVSRTEQNGPELVGRRANGQGLDLNRDYVKAEAPETRAALALFARWNPDAFVDLHTTDGSYHGYALTWSPSLHPAARLGPYVQDTLLPAVAARVRARWGLATFPYGNFSAEYGEDVRPGARPRGWFTYEPGPRFGTNYYGLRGGLSVLSEAYSHDPFERRVRATYAFVSELLSAVAADAGGVRARVAAAPPPPASRAPADPGPVALGGRLTTRPAVAPVLAEELAATGDFALTQPGVPRGLRRTGRFRPWALPVYDRFEPTRTAPIPAGGWAWPADGPAADSAAALLGRHGVGVLRGCPAPAGPVAVFRVDSVVVAPRPFQGHRTVRLAGAWATAQPAPAAGASTYYVVPARQPLARLAAVLLEPESDDGLVTWNVWDRALRPGAAFPVVRVLTF